MADDGSSPVLVEIDASRITDWTTFHDVFAGAFGFPGFYGRNMNAWIDCMTSLDAPEDGLSTVHCAPGAVVTISVNEVASFASRCPEQYGALIDCAAFVNWRRIEQGDGPVLALAFNK